MRGEIDEVEEKKHICRDDQTQISPHVREPLICIRQNKSRILATLRGTFMLSEVLCCIMFFIHLHAEPMSHLLPIKWDVLAAMFAC